MTHYLTTVHLVMDVDHSETDIPDALNAILTADMRKYGSADSCLIDWAFGEHGSAADSIEAITLPADYEPDETPFPFPPTPAKFRDRKSFTPLEMEAALCAWEDLCERRTDNVFYKPLFEKHGTAAMRHVAMQAGYIAERVYAHMEAQGWEFHSAYDWEFVPAVLDRLDWDTLIADNQYNGAPYTPDIAALFAQVLAGAPDDFEKADAAREKDRRFAWLAKAKAAGIKWWAYDGMSDDNPEKFEAAFQRGDDPEEFVKAEGERLDLHKFGKAWG